MKRSLILGLIILVLILFLNLVVKFPLNHDVAWFMSAARRMLEGETLYLELIDVNPPLVLYLLVPTVLMADLAGISDAVALKISVVCIATSASLWFLGLVGLVGAGRQWGRAVWWIAILGFALLVLPASDFGQREHLLVLLSLPFTAVKWRRANQMKLRAWEAFSAGIVGGIGFAIKPHFLLIWLALEAFVAVRLHLAGATIKLRAESVGVAFVLAVYSIFVVVFHPEYFVMIRQLGELYSQFFSDSSRLLLIVAVSLPTIIVFFGALIVRSRSRLHALTLLFLVVALAGFIAAMIQGKGWRYHSLPLIIATLLAGAALLDESVRMLLQNIRRPERLRRLTVLVMLVIVAYPFGSNLNHAVHLANARAAEYAREADHLKRYAVGSILILADRVPDAYPLTNNLGVRSVSPFPSMWWIRAIYESPDASSPVIKEAPGTDLERSLSQQLVAAFVDSPPDLILVDVAAHERYAGQAFPYLEYFSRDPAFSRVLACYEPVVGGMGRFAILRLSCDKDRNGGGIGSKDADSGTEPDLATTARRAH